MANDATAAPDAQPPTPRFSYAPNYDVPENVSPFVFLPTLTLCSRCQEPQEPLRLWCAVVNERVVRDLCETCAEAIVGGAA